MPNHFLNFLMWTVVLLALYGWLTYFLHAKVGPHADRLFLAGVTFVVAGILVVIVFGTNYELATTGLARFIFAEKIKGNDPITVALFHGSHIRINNQLALVIIAFTFFTTALALSTTKQLIAKIRSRAWAIDKLSFGITVVAAICGAFAAVVTTCMDTALLLARNAMLLYRDEYAATAGNMPDPMHVIAQHPGQMGSLLLTLAIFWYPVIVIVAEIHFSSSHAALIEASHQVASMNAGRIPVGGPLGPPAPPAAPMPVAPIQVAPVAAPPPIAPLPGGGNLGGDFIRPVPFNVGAAPRNGHH